MPRSSSPAASWFFEKPGRREEATARTSTRSFTPALFELVEHGFGRRLFIADGEKFFGLGHGTPGYFTRSINSIAPAGARTLPSWIT